MPTTQYLISSPIQLILHKLLHHNFEVGSEKDVVRAAEMLNILEPLHMTLEIQQKNLNFWC